MNIPQARKVVIQLSLLLIGMVHVLSAGKPDGLDAGKAHPVEAEEFFTLKFREVDAFYLHDVSM